MLRIKADKWQEFCERAEELGFKRGVFNGDVYYQFCSIKIDFIVVDCDRKIDVNIMGNDDRVAHMLYDLITQGFVEKVEG